jgi:ribulose-phosphate 3-epimerase
MPESIRIAPSVLSADFGRLGEQVLEAVEGGADSIHLDVMDGHFVPNLTFGPPVIQALRTQTDAAFDVHMMVENPERYIPALAEARVDLMTVHVEAVRHLHRVVHQIKDAGILAGVALNPATPVSAVEEILPDLDLVLVMSVNPGFGGQTFIESSVEKIEHVRRMLNERDSTAALQVDGGIGPDTAERVVLAGARVLVAGSAVFNSPHGIAGAIDLIRRNGERGLTAIG